MTKSSTVYGIRFEDGAWVPIQQQQKCYCGERLERLENRFSAMARELQRLNDKLNKVHGAR